MTINWAQVMDDIMVKNASFLSHNQIFLQP